MSPRLAVMGAVALGLAWASPWLLPRGGFALHMTAHVAVVAVAAPLLALAMAGGPLDLARRAPRCFPPVPWSLVELVVVWAWHAPALHHLARHTVAGRVAEQGTFLATSLAVWLSAVGGPHDRPRRRGAGVVALLLTSMHMTLLGALLALSPRALYPGCSGASALSAIDDQHLGGAVMLLVGGASYLAGGVALTAGLLRAAPLGARP